MSMGAIAKMPTYEAYKDSGVEWLGEVPEGWTLERLKFAARINPTLRIDRESYEELACFLPMESVETNGSVDFSVKKTISQLKVGFTSFKRGDVILAKITPCFENGKGAYLELMPTRYGFGSTEFHVIRVLVNHSSKFIYYLTKSDLFMNLGERLMIGSAGQKRVSTQYVENFKFASPSKENQTLIANFLDQKTAQIDEAIAIKEQQIALLKERKQIVIQKAVTKGLDPDVPMKDSGVDWIGEIPAHWELRANRSLYAERVEAGQEGLPLLMVSIHSGVSREEVSSEENIRGRVRIEDKTKYIIVKPGDIVFNMMRAWQGGIGAVATEGMVSPAYIAAKPKADIIAEFFEHQYRCPEFIQQMDRYSKGITDFRKRLYWDSFKQLLTVVPPKDEQLKIIDQIQKLSESTEQTINMFQNQISKLKEYKTTLINSAVTGKIRITPEMVA